MYIHLLIYFDFILSKISCVLSTVLLGPNIDNYDNISILVIGWVVFSMI